MTNFGLFIFCFSIYIYLFWYKLNKVFLYFCQPIMSHICCVNLQEMCSLQCSLHEVNKGEQTRVVVDSQVTQHGGSREFLIVQ